MNRPVAERPEGGFTLMEIMISLTVLLIGIVGLLSMQLNLTRESSFSRHTVEASVIGEDTMEKLFVVPMAVIDPDNNGVAFTETQEDVNALGVPETDGFFSRQWSLVRDTTNFATLTVEVTWSERGQPYTITLVTQRSLL